jgi:hypothetical protein
MRLNVIFAVTGVVACLGLAVLARADYESEVMADHPLVYYRFEDATCNSGDTCKDSANNLYKNGTYQVNGSWSNLVFEAGIPGPSGQAIRFNGSGSGGAGHCVDIWDGNAIVASNMTVEVWMMSTDVNNYPRLLQHNGKYNDPNNYGIGEYNDVSGGHITVMGGGSTWYTGTPAIWDGNWHLIDVTYQQIDTNLYEYVYIDGVGIWGHTVDNASLLKHYDRLTLGCEGNRWYCDNGFNGRLDEVAIYDTVLDANRIALHYALGLHATGTLQFKSSTYTIAESGGSIRIYVSRADGSYGSASVNYATADDTATAGSDYTVESGTLNWSDGDANDKYFDVNIIDDSIAENNETFDVNLSDANGASLGSPSQTTVTILINDQPAGSLQFNSSTYTVAENGGSIRIYVGRTDGSYGEASVNYATADDTATAGSDYTAESGTLNWSDGDANDKYFDVNIIDDSIAENNETFDVNLSDANGASLGSPSQTIVTIDDNDSPIISGYVRTPNGPAAPL